ncbi:DUF4270 domain-containing protein [Pontibacter sp. E15-1]|uniref:DUF4270 family protein n=1 Tax=Pontibacter sp. E15-1 TaxID=2919918 RepID=UPI001F503823|nr:DUF4270 family protein [Pontibacter sp. E15-1]MCJ8166995.1 DUF4270 domain-containing protein [Pontibacter sp. E15-1]
MLLQNKVTLLLCCCCVTLASCEDPNELGLGLVDDNISGKFTDTLTVNVSTVYLDSVVSSNSGALLAGQYTTPFSGTLQGSAFFQVGLSSSTWTVAEDATADSVKLIMPYTKYSYGDTTQAVSFSVQRLTGTITPRKLSPYFFNEAPLSYFYADNVLYNASTTGVAADELAAFTVIPRPNTKADTIAVSLSGELGQEWLSLKKAGDARLTNATDFLTYFPGLKLTGTAGNAMVGFSTANSKVRLYYSETVNGTKTARRRDFAIVNPGLQYNRFESDFTGTPLEGIERGGAPVPAAQTDNFSVAQGGAGLMIKVEVPNLASLRGQLPADLINRAVLIVEPLANTTQHPYPVPNSLALYTTNSANIPLTPLPLHPKLVPANNPLAVAYVAPTAQYPNGRYDFNLTPHLVELLKSEKTGGLTLLLAPSIGGFTQEVSRVVLGGPENQQKSIRLKIYYTTIK